MKYEDCDALIKALKLAFEDMVKQKAEELLKNDLKEGRDGEYFMGYDRDSVDVGVGSVIVRQDIVQNEERAFEDAKDQVHEDLLCYEEEAIERLFENEDFNRALDNFLKGC